ncbi:hypothetical protein BD413DRAFT_603443 [Trametes elegans]|nr:hypothetical protein BD413DRAFT_603443 [Trametes elegans]
MPLLHSRSLGSLSGLLDNPPSTPTAARRSKTPDKPLPLTPQPSNSMSLSPFGPSEDDEETLVPTTASARSSLTVVTSKRTHALLELLSSERAYASDLALIRDVHVPLALGQPAPFSATPATPATPPGSSGSSSRTLSTTSDSSAGSSSSQYAPPMTRHDVRSVFLNIEQLATFADAFTEALEVALGDIVEGGSGEDGVGKLLLDVIPQLEPLYREYITKHPSSLEHLKNLPQTPALTEYLARTKTLASSLSHAWDLPSLLIKPVQRLLKYPLLLKSIIEETPDAHGDKENLRLAHDKLQEVASDINEGCRRREIVLEPAQKRRRKGEEEGHWGLGIAGSISLGRMKSLRSAGYKAKEGAEANKEAEEVRELGKKLRKNEEFLQRFSSEMTAWAEAMHALMVALDEWAQSFGRVIWMGTDERSEAFDAFLKLIGEELLPICEETQEYLEETIRPELNEFIKTTLAPLQLLEAMRTLEPVHYALLNLNIAKSRPNPDLLEASKAYVSLRAQLFAELPEYIRLFDKGIALIIVRWTMLQYRFYSSMRERWAQLWDALKVDSEANVGAVETLRVWWERYREVETALQSLNIVRPPEKKAHGSEKGRRKSGGKQSSLREGDATQSIVVSSVLSALDPLNIPATQFAISPGPVSGKARSVRSLEAENALMQPPPQTQMAGRRSTESFQSKKSGKSRPPSTRGHSMGGATLVDEAGYTYPMPHITPLTPPGSDGRAETKGKPPYERTKSMPLSPSSSAPLQKSQSQSRLLEVPADEYSPHSSNPSLHSFSGSLQEDSRGRPSRKPSIRRRLTDSFRASTRGSSESRHRRSPSLPSSMGFNATPSPSPNKATFGGSGPPSRGGRKRSSGGQIPALYECRVIHPVSPPDGVSYRDIGFFRLRVGEIYDILMEAGHPATHKDLPLYVDEGEDCLLLARNGVGDVGWVLASFLLPVD